MGGDSFFVGIDVGSASVRAGVFSAAGHRLAFATRPIEQFRPRAQFVEQSTANIWQQVCEAVREAMAAARVAPADVLGIGFDATCSLVAVAADGGPVSVAEDGAPLRDVVMWMDHRAGAEARSINATGDDALAYVGGEVSVEMELPKVLWLRRHFPDRYAAAWRFFDLADYLVWRATDQDVGSVCTLTCKWNYLAHEERFSNKLLAAVGLDGLPNKIPQRILQLGSRAGGLSASAASRLGLMPGTAVATGIIDAHAGGLALVGTQPVGSLALIAGTSNCHMASSASPLMVPGVWGPYFGAMLPGLWLAEAGQSAAGSLLEWTIRQSDAWPELSAAANAAGCSPFAVLNGWLADLRRREAWPTRHLHVLPDHYGNRSPRADPHATGSAVGLSMESGRDASARMYLASVQGLAYGTRHIIESLNAAGHRIDRVVVCGGATRNPVFMQEHADVIGRDIHLVEDEDPVTLGAALLAATASGAFASLTDAARAMVRPGERIRANRDAASFHEAKYRIFLRMYEDQLHYRAAMAHLGDLS